MASTTTSATATIIQAAEKVVIEEATAVAKQLASKNAAEIKTIVNGVAQETVAAKDHSIGDIVQDVEDGAKVIGSEIVKGAGAVITAVEKHPELIAEGALALGIGVASLVQPELIVGSVALVGKMAADASKETINQIVLESGSSVVKGVAKEVTEETAELAAQDAAEKAKAAALETAKDGSNAGVEATVDVKSAGTVTTELVTSEGSKDGEKPETKVLTTVSGDATAIVREVTPGDAPGPVISSETIQTSATSTSEVKGNSKTVTEEGPAVVVTTNDLTGDKTAAVKQGSTTAVVEESASAEPSLTEQKPVAVASVDVKALAKEVAREMTELEAAKSAQTGETSLESAQSTETSSDKSLKSAAAKLEANLKKSAKRPDADASTAMSQAEPKIEMADTQEGKAKPTEDAERLSEPTPDEQKVAVQDTPILAQLGIVHIESTKEDAPKDKVPENETTKDEGKNQAMVEPITESPEAKESAIPELAQQPLPAPETIAEDAKTEISAQSDTLEEQVLKTETKTDEIPEPVTETAVRDSEPVVVLPKQSTKAPKTGLESEQESQTNLQSTPQVLETSPTQDITAHAVTHAAVLEAHDKIAKLHESNELLHQKLDTMQEALLAITKALSDRSPAPSPLPPTAETEPLSTPDNQIILASANPPSTAAINKRMSVFGTIGWLFGAGSGSGSTKKHKRGKSIATSTPASVPAGGSE